MDMAPNLRGTIGPMHVRARPPAAVLYGALLAHTLVSAANDLFAKRALMEIMMTSVVSYLLWSWALAHLAAVRVAVFNNLQPLATALMAQVFLGVRVTAGFFAAAAVVIAGVLMAQWRAVDAAEEALLESPAKS